MNNKKPKKNARQILAIICIAILLGLYALNLILALIGSEFSTNLLKGTFAITIMLPIIMYGCLVLMKATSSLRRKPEDELTEEEKEGYYRMLEEREEKRIKEQEERKARKKK